MAGIGMKKYTFEVAKDAQQRLRSQRAVEELFGVKVSKVNTMHVQRTYCAARAEPRATLLLGRRPIVTLTEDSKTIEFFEGMM